MKFPNSIPIGWAISILFAGMYLGRNEVRLARAEDSITGEKANAAKLQDEVSEIKIVVSGIQRYLENNVPIIRQDTEATRKELNRRSK